MLRLRGRGRSSPIEQQVAKKPPSNLISLLTGHESTQRKIVFTSQKGSKMWTAADEACLIHYLMTKGYFDAWPKSHPPCVELWEGAARYMSENCKSKTKRTSKYWCIC